MNQKGQVWLTVMLAIFVLALIGGAVLSWSSFSLRSARRLKYSLHAFYYADAGAERAIYWLKNDPDNNWSDCNLDPLFDEANYRVKTYDGDMSNIKVESRGIYKGVKRKVYMEMKNYSNVFTNAVFSGSILNSAGNIEVDGNVLVSDTITVKGNLNVTSGNTITEHANIGLPGIVEREALINSATLNKDNGNAGPSGNYFTGGSPTFTSLNGVIFYDCPGETLTLSGTLSTTDISLRSYLVVDGNLEMSGDITFKGLVYVSGNLTINGSVSTYNVVAGSITMSGGHNLDISYSDTYADPPFFQKGVVSIIWREISP